MNSDSSIADHLQQAANSPRQRYSSIVIAQLAGKLRDHVAGRQPDLTLSKGLIRGILLTVLEGPPELGKSLTPSSLLSEASQLLSQDASTELDEAVACQLWLQCNNQVIPPDAAARWKALVRQPLWNPVRVLAYRALAYFGHRQFLRELIPGEGPLLIYEADALLEAALLNDLPEGWQRRIISIEHEAWPQETQVLWSELLVAEAALAFQKYTEQMANRLNAICSALNQTSATTPGTLSEYLLSRAVAAAMRARLGLHQPHDGVFESDAAQFLPRWEREYYRGLRHLSLGDHDAAVGALHLAWEANSNQSCIELALLSAGAPLKGDHPRGDITRELACARAAKSARQQRYDEAAETLGRMADLGREPARKRWSNAAGDYGRQEVLLRTAIAEHRHDWIAAAHAWSGSPMPVANRTLQAARTWFHAEQERRDLPHSKAWRREVLEQKIDLYSREMGGAPVTGDALFFRAAARAAEGSERGVRDLQTLMRQRSWVDSERAVGGGRLIAAGDMLLLQGKAGDAEQAYERAGNSVVTAERSAVALLLAQLRCGVPLAVLARSAVRAEGMAPASPWPPLFATVGLLMAGDFEAARAYLSLACQRGGPSPVCELLGVLTHRQAPAASQMTVSAMRVPPAVEAIVQCLLAPETDTRGLEMVVRSLGEEWPQTCPFQPESVARRLLSARCADGRWVEVHAMAAELARIGEHWATELATLARLRLALYHGAQGALTDAAAALKGICEPTA